MSKPNDIQIIANACPTCGEAFMGKFCYACGEKQINEKDLSLKKFAEQTVDIFTHFDGKFFQSVKYLLLYPGKLTAEFLAGRRVKLMKPLQLYIIINIIYFFLLKQVDLFLYYLKYMVAGPDPVAILARRLVAKGAAHKGISTAAYIEAFDNTLPDTAKAFIILLIPLLAIGLWMLNFTKQKKIVPHIVFATHFFSFMLLFFMIYAAIVILPISKTDVFKAHHSMFVSLVIIPVIWYMYASFKRVYKQSIFITALKTLGFVCWFVLVIAVYRTGIAYVHYLLI
ncbi:DUF3667 domain-containing protein [Mucilaginibacter terrigena]|uniref:DUF3667 domain-containing protein n=1 Tax=Mucilaginibacter terrigena TaxID=2492395 RepID=A0A4Q5LLB3_9SPHI|nr:DUF3667 domain-containing protein [Mucilaginibacter terrigena]RYU90514.1 DUF3667 domain-containing protein [Mucilaginibacter terrigena]